METRPLTQSDVHSIWSINEQGLPGTGQVSEEEVSDLLKLSTLSFGVFRKEELVGFVICLSPRTEYKSLNYGWFNEKYDDFIYVDRIAVSLDHRNKGIGSKIYAEVIAYSQEHEIPVAAEVNLNPPNPGSMRFHHRFNFKQVGVFNHEQKSVTMLLRSHLEEN
ncbi:MAG: GNAT family N-acetyltransferase [Candidatus Poseidoniaceae archaeon]|nr:GNAT family N-acetyltransferase [Candidatus Poseidoniaceae archaeon]